MRIERRLSVGDEIEKELDQALARADRLRQSMFQSAFDGILVGREEGVAFTSGFVFEMAENSAKD